MRKNKKTKMSKKQLIKESKKVKLLNKSRMIDIHHFIKFF